MRISVTAPKGKMGSLILQSAIERNTITIAAALAPSGRPYLGQDAGLVCGLGASIGTLITDDWNEALQNTDILIDFSTVETGRFALNKALEYRIPLICGTTGFSPEDHAAFRSAAQSIPIMPAANTSRVIHLMSRLLKLSASELGSKADIELIEMHDRNKLDSPSGTSKELGHAICEGLGQNWESSVVFGRHGHGARKTGELGYHSIRSGDISSSHTVLFGLTGERLEITHHAHNWRCFAEGALDCAEFLVGKAPGLYTVENAFRR